MKFSTKKQKFAYRAMSRSLSWSQPLMFVLFFFLSIMPAEGGMVGVGLSPDAIRCGGSTLLVHRAGEYHQVFADEIRSITFNPDGTFNSRTGNDPITAPCDGLSLEQLQGAGNAFEFCQDCSSMLGTQADAIACGDNVLFARENRVFEQVFAGEIRSVTFNPDGSFLSRTGADPITSACQGQSLPSLLAAGKAFAFSSDCGSMSPNPSHPDAIKCGSSILFASRDGEYSQVYALEVRKVTFSVNGAFLSRAGDPGTTAACDGQSTADLSAAGDAFQFAPCLPTIAPSSAPTSQPSAPTGAPTELLVLVPVSVDNFLSYDGSLPGFLFAWIIWFYLHVVVLNWISFEQYIPMVSPRSQPPSAPKLTPTDPYLEFFPDHVLWQTTINNGVKTAVFCIFATAIGDTITTIYVVLNLSLLVVLLYFLRQAIDHSTRGRLLRAELSHMVHLSDPDPKFDLWNKRQAQYVEGQMRSSLLGFKFDFNSLLDFNFFIVFTDFLVVVHYFACIDGGSGSCVSGYENGNAQLACIAVIVNAALLLHECFSLRAHHGEVCTTLPVPNSPSLATLVSSSWSAADVKVKLKRDYDEIHRDLNSLYASCSQLVMTLTTNGDSRPLHYSCRFQVDPVQDLRLDGCMWAVMCAVVIIQKACHRSDVMDADAMSAPTVLTSIGEDEVEEESKPATDSANPGPGELPSKRACISVSAIKCAQIVIENILHMTKTSSFAPDEVAIYEKHIACLRSFAYQCGLPRKWQDDMTHWDHKGLHPMVHSLLPSIAENVLNKLVIDVIDDVVVQYVVSKLVCMLDQNSLECPDEDQKEKIIDLKESLLLVSFNVYRGFLSHRFAFATLNEMVLLLNAKAKDETIGRRGLTEEDLKMLSEWTRLLLKDITLHDNSWTIDEDEDEDNVMLKLGEADRELVLVLANCIRGLSVKLTLYKLGRPLMRADEKWHLPVHLTHDAKTAFVSNYISPAAITVFPETKFANSKTKIYYGEWSGGNGGSLAVKVTNAFDIENEYNNQVKVKHPNVLSAYGICESVEVGGNHLGKGLIMERALCSVGSIVHSTMFNNAASPMQATEVSELFLVLRLRFLRQASLAMKVLHKQKIWHRDLKPANLLVTPGLVAKIADFGDLKEAYTSMSSTNNNHGTQCYMPPRYEKGDGDKHDIYAFGVCMWEMFTSKGFADYHQEEKFWTASISNQGGSLVGNFQQDVNDGFRYLIPGDDMWPSNLMSKESNAKLKMLIQRCWYGADSVEQARSKPVSEMSDNERRSMAKKWPRNVATFKELHRELEQLWEDNKELVNRVESSDAYHFLRTMESCDSVDDLFPYQAKYDQALKSSRKSPPKHVGSHVSIGAAAAKEKNMKPSWKSRIYLWLYREIFPHSFAMILQATYWFYFLLCAVHAGQGAGQRLVFDGKLLGTLLIALLIMSGPVYFCLRDDKPLPTISAMWGWLSNMNMESAPQWAKENSSTVFVVAVPLIVGACSAWGHVSKDEDIGAETFLGLPPYYDLTVPRQQYLVPFIYAIMRCCLITFGLLPLTMCRLTMRELRNYLPILTETLYLDHMHSIHRKLGYLLMLGINAGALLWMLALYESCAENAISGACVGFHPEGNYFDIRGPPWVCTEVVPDRIIQQYFSYDSCVDSSTDGNPGAVIFLREVVIVIFTVILFTSTFVYPLIPNNTRGKPVAKADHATANLTWAAKAQKWGQKYAYEVFYYSHIVTTWLAAFAVVFSRTEVFFWPALVWAWYFIDVFLLKVMCTFRTEVRQICLDKGHHGATVTFVRPEGFVYEPGQTLYVRLPGKTSYVYKDPKSGEWRWHYYDQIDASDMDTILRSDAVYRLPAFFEDWLRPRCWERHPFSICTYIDHARRDVLANHETDDLSLFIESRAEGTWTNALVTNLCEPARVCDDTSLEFLGRCTGCGGDKIEPSGDKPGNTYPHFVELMGPLGASMQHSNNIVGVQTEYDGMLLVGAGTGLAGAMSCLRKISREGDKSSRKINVSLIWSVRSVHNLYSFWDELVQELCFIQGDRSDMFPLRGWLHVYIHISQLKPQDRPELDALIAQSAVPKRDANGYLTSDKVDMSALMGQAICPGRCDRRHFRDRMLAMRSSSAGAAPNVNIYYCGGKPLLDEITEAVNLLPHTVTMNSNNVPLEIHAEGFG